jgi:hypothetical protein
MKPVARQVLIGVVALILGAIPAFALAASPGRDAAADEYGTVPTGTTPTSTTPTSTVGVTVTVGATTPTVEEAVTTPTETETSENENENEEEEGQPRTTTDGTEPAGTGGSAPGAGSGAAGLNCGKIAYIGLSPLRNNVVEDTAALIGDDAFKANIDEPLDPKAIAALTKGTEWEGAESDDKKLKAFGEAVGLALPDGKPLAKAAFATLADITDGEIGRLSGIIFTHRAIKLDGDADSARDAFIDGLIRGLRQVRVATTDDELVPFPTVGAEVTSTKPSTITFFANREVSTVDDVDTKDGKASLQNVLAGSHGHFGTKKTAEDGEKAPAPEHTVLACRPDVTYRIGELLRVASGGIPGGGMSIGILLLLGLAVAGGGLALAERKTRRFRRHRVDVA